MVSGRCRVCANTTNHKLYFGKDGYLHSKCEGCESDVLSFAPTGMVVGERRRSCPRCGAVTDQFRYESREGHLYLMCSSCGTESTAE